MQKWEMVVKAADISLQKPCQGMSGREDKVFRQHRREFVEPVFDRVMISDRYSEELETFATATLIISIAVFRSQ